ncbi:tRNA (adenosine(37)-N6)-threonylcarbamoyltransferase complex dimerization subunit type 1 TsaB [Prauserella halophila]|uniref:tRNA (Adenosine(37)-N6)-threonylcarbamoyltransferase complex dimerization subunit type 1 TsaB n=1 Tax=Prauserella halophila TaxID=185641 RepID=A0ABP4H3X8_9PSEU|nr:tRNA (adenosine(37)-N6)-threonylcarbamoyltransferase complex dimerization subunit type 1 TsaB [Prauserella halophila]MCP2238538.1 tRNA threonylcarbamoyl adenosine modification protein YeaZ [Prauserella halophila]
MLILALDTATPAVTAGIVRLSGPAGTTGDTEAGDTEAARAVAGGTDANSAAADGATAVAAARPVVEQVAARVTVDPRAHGELLTPHLLEATADAGITLADLGAVAVGTGPGPYTGLRAGLVTGAALAHSLGVPAYPVCTLDAIAAGPACPALVVTDARRREVYWATYDASGARTDGPHVGSRAEVPETAGHVADHEQPTPEGVVRAAAAEILTAREPGPLTPLYLRRPHAAEPTPRKRVTA